jgi:hypothetical protein
LIAEAIERLKLRAILVTRSAESSVRAIPHWRIKR